MWISRKIKFANEFFRGTPIFRTRAFYAPVENYLRGYEYSIISDNQRKNPFFGLNREKNTQLNKEIYSIKILVIQVVII